jgi:hypothetical protein
MGAALNVEVHTIDSDTNFISTWMLKQFRASMTFGEMKRIYKSQVAILSDDKDEDVLLDINLYLKRDQLPNSLGYFNISVPCESMLVQMNLDIEGCELRDTIGSVMVIHLDKHDKLMEGLLNVYFLDSLYKPANLGFLMKSSQFRIRSSYDNIYHTSIPGFVSHPELQINALVKVSDTVCKMMFRLAASQPRTYCVHIDMMAAVWLVIKAFLLQETNDKVIVMYHNNDICVPTVKHGIFVTPDKRIQLATIKRETEEHHKFDRMIAYTRERIIILQQLFGFTFGIGARVRHPRANS